MLEQANEKYQVAMDVADIFNKIESTEVPLEFLAGCWGHVRTIAGYAIDLGPIRFFDADAGDPYDVQGMIDENVDPVECALYQIRLRNAVMRGAKADAMNALVRDVRFMRESFGDEAICGRESDCMPRVLKAAVSFYGCMGEFFYALSDEDKTDGVDMFLLGLMRFQGYLLHYIEKNAILDAFYCDETFARELCFLVDDYKHRLDTVERFSDLPAFEKALSKGDELIDAVSAKFGGLDGWKKAIEENTDIN